MLMERHDIQSNRSYPDSNRYGATTLGITALTMIDTQHD
jgi:hypothetical protein